MDILRHQFLSLLKYALSDAASDYSSLNGLSGRDWLAVRDFAAEQGAFGICFDYIEKLPSECCPDIDDFMDWLGYAINAEREYKEHLKIIQNLASFFRSQQIKAVLLKGYGLSLNYPQPNHRATGDIDLYHCGQGELADHKVKELLDIDVKQNEEKHSTYAFENVHVENHATVICELEHKSLSGVERFLEDELKDHSVYDETSGCYLPSALFNAVYLPIHFGNHFVFEGANIRQIVDYALMVKKQHQSIDWDTVKQLAIEGGFYKFQCCLNGICIHQLGIPASCFPAWERDTAMEERILKEILSQKPINATLITGKLKRYFANRWKYRLVYGNDSHLKGFFLRFRSWLIWKWGLGRKSVWEK